MTSSWVVVDCIVSGQKAAEKHGRHSVGTPKQSLLVLLCTILALSLLPFQVVGEGCSEVMYYRYHSSTWISQSAQLTTARSHSLSNGFLEFGEGMAKNEKLFEEVLLKKNALSVDHTYYARITASVSTKTEENNLMVGLSDGKQVVGFMRSDKKTRHIGATFVGVDALGHVTDVRYGSRGGESDTTATSFEIYISFSVAGIDVFATTSSVPTPSTMSDVPAFDSGRPLKLVAFQSEKVELSMIGGIEVAIYRQERKHMFLTGQALMRSLRFPNRSRQREMRSGRLEIDRGKASDETLWEIPIIQREDFVDGEAYSISVKVSTESMSKDNDLHIGLSDGSNVMGWMRADADNGHIGWPFDAMYSGSRITGKKTYTPGGATAHTPKYLELLFSVTPDTFEVTGRAGDESSPISHLSEKVLDRTRALSLVGVANGAHERYAFYAIEVIWTQGGGPHTVTFERLWTMALLNKYLVTAGKRSHSIMNNYLAITTGALNFEEMFEMPFLKPGQLEENRDYTFAIDVYTEPITQDNDLKIGLFDGTGVVLFQRVDAKNKRIGEFVYGQITPDRHFKRSGRGPSGGETNHTPKWFQILISLKDDKIEAIARCNDGAFVATLLVPGGILDRRRPISVIAVADNPREEYGFYAIRTKVWREGNYGKWEAEAGVGHLWGEMFSRRAPEPYFIKQLDGVSLSKISLGADHTVVLSGEGEVYAWGLGSFGQTGHGLIQDFKVPKQVTALSGDVITDIATGMDHTVAVKEDGSVWSWGRGDWGQLGHGDTLDDRFPRKVGMLDEEGIEVVSVACGAEHSLALSSKGKVFSWGKGESGQLGLGTRESSNSPQLVHGISNATEICAGWDFSLVLANGEVFSFGHGEFGQLGLLGSGDAPLSGVLPHNNLYQNRDVLTPVKVDFPKPGRISGISCGGEHAGAMTEDGDLFTWGRADQGQLGHNDEVDRRVPKEVEALRDKCVRGIALGGDHSFSLLEDGSLYGWGRANAGQLGMRSSNRNVPTHVQAVQHNVKQIFAAFDHSGALLADKYTLTKRALGDGWKATFFPNPNLHGMGVEEREPTIDISMLPGESPATGIPADNLSVRFEGMILAPFADRFEFLTETREGVRLWVDGHLVIDHWTDTGVVVQNHASVMLKPEVKTPVIMEVFEKKGGMTAKLWWSSVHVPKQIIPMYLVWQGGNDDDDSGDGLLGAYFPNIALRGEHKSRVDRTVDFEWKDSPMPGIPPDNFSVRWSGMIKPEHSDTYSFFTVTDDGGRLWVDEKLIINDWTRHAPTERQARVYLKGDVAVPIRFEFFEAGGGAVARLSWSSSMVPKQIVGTKYLYSGRNHANKRKEKMDGGKKSVDHSLADELDDEDSMNPYWIWQNEPKNWDVEAKGMILIPEPPGELWREQNVNFMYQETNGVDIDVETHIVIDYQAGYPGGTCVLGGLMFYSPQDGQWVTIKAWAGDRGSILQYQTRHKNIVKTVPGSQMPIEVGISEFYIRLRRSKNKYTSYFKTIETDPWTKVSRISVDLHGTLQVGIYGGLCQKGGHATIGFEYFRDNVVPVLDANPKAKEGIGLTGHYYHGTDLKGDPEVRIDPVVNFVWTPERPPWGGWKHTMFSVRWTGFVMPEYSEMYTFFTVCDDGCRLWIKGVPLIDDWQAHAPTESTGSIKLQANEKYPIQLEYFQQGGGATIQLLWTSGHTLKKVIPKPNLFPDDSEDDKSGKKMPPPVRPKLIPKTPLPRRPPAPTVGPGALPNNKSGQKNKAPKKDEEESRVGRGILGNIRITADNEFVLYVNGEKMTDGDNWKRSYPVSAEFFPGTNTLAVQARNTGGVAGLIAEADVNGRTIVTDQSWKCTNQHHTDWEKGNFSDVHWANAIPISNNGAQPWGPIKGISSAAYWIWTASNGFHPQIAADKEIFCRRQILRLGSGYVSHTLISAPREMEIVSNRDRVLATFTHLEQTDLSDMVEADKKLGHVKLTLDMWVSNKDYYISRFEYTKDPNSKGFIIPHLPEPKGGWKVGQWNHFEMFIPNKVYVREDLTPWSNMNRLRIYRTGPPEVPSNELSNLGKIKIKDLKIVKSKDPLEPLHVNDPDQGAISYDQWKEAQQKREQTVKLVTST